MVDIAQLKDLIVNGVGRFIGKVYASEFIGKLTGNADTATSATKATGDESGNNIKSSYASSISISDHTITLKNKNGASLGTVTVPDNNTWRGIQNNLTSDSTTDSLSAAQGKVLKGLVDGKASSSHTHNYAGSSSAGGAANSALGLSPFTISNIDELDSFLSDNAIMKYAKASSCNIGFVSNDGLVISLPWSSKYGAQIAIDDQSNWMGIRTKNNGTWNSWSKIALVSDIPTSLPASDVYSWAKASSKPSYSWSEITSKPSTFTPASHTHSYAGSSSAGGSATSAVSVVDYADSSKTIKIGFAGNGATTSNLAYIAGYLSGGTQIKDVSKDTLKSWLGLGSAAYTNSDAYATASHSHNYAGSSSAGGSAISAVKLDSSAGSATQPVYFSGGKPVACTYTLGKSVPSNAVFTDTNTWRPVTDDLTSTSTSNCLSANQGRVLKELIDGKAASDHTHSNYLENGDYISCKNSIVSIDGDLDVAGIVSMAGAMVEKSYVSCVKTITSGSKVTITIQRNNLGYSIGLLDDISIKCYVNGYGDCSVDIYNNGPTVAASWNNSSSSSYYPTIGCSYTSTTATITLTATFSTTKFLVIRYCPGLTTITVS